MRQGWFSPLSRQMTEIFRSLEILETIQYRGEPLTTLAYRYYNNVDGWIFILGFNGYLHPDEMRSGILIKIPNVEAVIAVLNRLESNKGDVIEV